MTKDELTKMAYAGIFPDIHMTQPELLLYYRLKEVYRAYKTGEMNEEHAKRDKEYCFKLFHEDTVEYNSGKDALYRIGKLFIDIEKATTMYRQNRKLETADMLMEVLYNVTK